MEMETMDRRQFVMNSVSASVGALADPGGASAPAAPWMIDAHVHVFRRDPLLPYAEGANAPAEEAPAEQLIGLMRTNGVARTVLIQVIHYRWDNRYVAGVLKRYPELFRGVCRVNPEDPAAPDALSRLTEEGFRGVRLSPAEGVAGDWIRGPLMRPLWKRCSELKVPMTLLVTPPRLPDLAPLIEANPELTVVIDHMAGCPAGRPELLKDLLALSRYPKVYVKISEMWSLSREAYPYADMEAQVGRIRDRFGARRMMWATNWPVSLKQLPYERIVALYRDGMTVFSAEERREVLAGTAARVWGFEREG